MKHYFKLQKSWWFDFWSTLFSENSKMKLVAELNKILIIDRFWPQILIFCWLVNFRQNGTWKKGRTQNKVAKIKKQNALSMPKTQVFQNITRKWSNSGWNMKMVFWWSRKWSSQSDQIHKLINRKMLIALMGKAKYSLLVLILLHVQNFCSISKMWYRKNICHFFFCLKKYFLLSS